ncbi:hypothetical protein VCHENC02_5232B, partial [Vibrio harveyi]
SDRSQNRKHQEGV